MDNVKNPPTEKSRNPPKQRPAQYTAFCAVVQCDYSNQMDVFRWLCSDSVYTLVWILHDRDRFTVDDMDKDENGNRLDYHERTDGQGAKTRYKVGDIKPPHIHMIVKCGAKLQENTMAGRFGNYVHFDGLSDIQAYALYLTHRTFDARNKYQYPEMAVQGDLNQYAEWAHLAQDEIEMGRRWLDYVHQARECSDADTFSTALKLAIAAGDKTLYKSVMSHSYFYKNFY